MSLHAGTENSICQDEAIRRWNMCGKGLRNFLQRDRHAQYS